MKKQFSLIGLSVIFLLAIVLTSFQKDKKEKGNQGQGKGKPAKVDNNTKNNDTRDPLGVVIPQKDKDNKGNNGKGNNGNKGIGNDNDNRGNDKVKGMGKFRDKSVREQWGYNWDRANFQDRKKFRSNEKVTICHKFNNGGDGVAINVSSNAVKAHMGHGDVMGACPVFANNSRFSDIFLRNRTDYYNTLYYGEEQVVYSQSILDYAIDRLTNSRQQLLVMQTSGAPLADIQRREQTIVVLEERTTLLEQLLGVAANLVASRLQ